MPLPAKSPLQVNTHFLSSHIKDNKPLSKPMSTNLSFSHFKILTKKPQFTHPLTQSITESSTPILVSLSLDVTYLFVFADSVGRLCAECHHKGEIIPTHWGLCAQWLWEVGSLFWANWLVRNTVETGNLLGDWNAVLGLNLGRRGARKSTNIPSGV